MKGNRLFTEEMDEIIAAVYPDCGSGKCADLIGALCGVTLDKEQISQRAYAIKIKMKPIARTKIRNQRLKAERSKAEKMRHASTAATRLARRAGKESPSFRHGKYCRYTRETLASYRASLAGWCSLPWGPGTVRTTNPAMLLSDPKGTRYG